MKQRGRKHVMAVAQDAGISSQERPEPPVELTPEQRIQWIQTVNALRADWFPPETHALLAQYCKHVVAAQHIGLLVSEYEKREAIDVGEYAELLRAQERESRVVMALARSMRLTQQSTAHRETQKHLGPKGGSPKPWEMEKRN